eukprot:TRINITY_DN5764_c0_g2_i2.p1 TRINITY_DN5764_c0_g2~~TRINITY_DN5764_c0_g2_i2.p1  ORF type:complete len:390 (+),score=51.64 TRINITY_DN5764_c0_g2_i2:41-1210(+)
MASSSATASVSVSSGWRFGRLVMASLLVLSLVFVLNSLLALRTATDLQPKELNTDNAAQHKRSPTKRIHFTHVITPFIAKNGSEHELAQAAMVQFVYRAIRAAYKQNINVELLVCVFKEDLTVIDSLLMRHSFPSEASFKVVILKSSNLDSTTTEDNVKHKLPLISEVFQLASIHADGTYVVFTNMDINLSEEFYINAHNQLDFQNVNPITVEDIELSADKKARVLDITRLDLQLEVIPHLHSFLGDNITLLEETEALLSTHGIEHPGHDCFVFPRQWLIETVVPKRLMGGMFLGYPKWGRFLVCLMRLSYSLKDPRSNKKFSFFRIIRKSGWTFHFGNSKRWQTESVENEALTRQNEEQIERVLRLHYPDLYEVVRTKTLVYLFSELC